MRRNQKRMSELKSTIRKLEDRNSILVDERNELVCFATSVIDVLCIEFSCVFAVKDCYYYYFIIVIHLELGQLCNYCWVVQDYKNSMHLLLCVVLETFLFLCLLFINISPWFSPLSWSVFVKQRNSVSRYWRGTNYWVRKMMTSASPSRGWRINLNPQPRRTWRWWVPLLLSNMSKLYNLHFKVPL